MQNIFIHFINAEFNLSSILAHITFSSPPLTFAAKFFSGVGYALPMWAIIIGATTYYEIKIHKNKNKFAQKLTSIFACLVIAFVIIFFVNDLLIKNVVARPRPYVTSWQEQNWHIGQTSQVKMAPTQIVKICPHDYSFASSHAAVAFATACILIYFDHNKKRHKFYAIVASLISVSRVLLFCHYPTDVLFGALFGILIANIAIKLYIRFKV